MPIVPSALERLVLLGLNQGPGPLLDLLGAAVFRALGVALRLGVFAALERGPRRADELATEIGAAPVSLEPLLGVLEAAGYVSRDGDHYRNTPMTARWLLATSPRSIADFVALWQGVVFDQWDRLEEAVRAGRPEPHLHDWLDQRPEGWRTFNRAMTALARDSADAIAAAVELPPDARRLVDLGGSHGLNAIAFCRRHPALSATVYDLPPALEGTPQIIATAGMTDRVSVRPGDLKTDDLGAGYDVALLFQLIHYFSPEQNRVLLRKVGAALDAGGLAVILDQLTGSTPSRSVDAFVRVLSLNYAVGLGGRVYGLAEIRAWLSDAGFVDIRRRSLRRLPGTYLILATRKPGAATAE